jgi:hypothetical protein
MRRRPIRIALVLLPIAAIGAASLVAARRHLAHADAPAGRYTNGNDGAVLWVKDNRTGLTWKKVEEGSTYSWATAKTVCLSPWRLPTLSELETLVDDTQATGATIDATYFPGTSNAKFWTSVPDAQSLATPKAWNVSFDTGANANEDQTTLARVRCVR